MRRDFDEKALWLVRTVVPHEVALRSWLKLRRVADLEIDDIIQETYAKILSLETTDGIRDPRAYAYQTANSILISHVRRSRIISIHASGDIERLNAEAPDASPERQLADRDELRELAIAIASMPEKCRTVFTLRRVDGLGHDEIARRLRISKKTVEKRMTEAIKSLMERFGRGGMKAAQPSKLIDRLRHTPNDAKTNDSGD